VAKALVKILLWDGVAREEKLKADSQAALLEAEKAFAASLMTDGYWRKMDSGGEEWVPPQRIALVKFFPGGAD